MKMFKEILGTFVFVLRIIVSICCLIYGIYLMFHPEFMTLERIQHWMAVFMFMLGYIIVTGDHDTRIEKLEEKLKEYESRE